jgi:hypothetical protein
MGSTKNDEEAGSLAVVEITDDEYETIYDARFISMNRDKAGVYEGEVCLSGDTAVDDARLGELLDIATIHGQRVDTMEYGLFDSVLIYFTPVGVG